MAEAIVEHLQPQRPLALRLALKTARLALGLIVTVPVTAPLLVLADSGIGYAVSYRDTDVTQIDNTENEKALTYDPNSATLFMNGFGEDISCKQAKAMQPAVGKFGKVACLTYASSFNRVADADKAYDAIFGNTPENTVVHLTIFTGSMGDKRGVQLGDEMTKRHGVKLEGIVMNTGAGPYGMGGVRSTLFKEHVAQRACEHAPGKATMVGLQVLLIEQLPGNQTDQEGLNEGVKKGLDYNNSVLQNQSCTIQEVYTVAPEEAPKFESVFYMRPDNPQNDLIIDNLVAENDWKQIFPTLQDVAVGGNVTHDNVSYRPEVFLPVVEGLYEQMRAKRQHLEMSIPRAQPR